VSCTPDIALNSTSDFMLSLLMVLIILSIVSLFFIGDKITTVNTLQTKSCYEGVLMGNELTLSDGKVIVLNESYEKSYKGCN
jgi:hypothetical protein